MATKTTNMRARDLLKTLTLAHGAPGFEAPVAKVIEKELKGLGQVSRDRLGSILVEKTGKAGGPRVMLAAHMDEVAFMVKAISESGLIKFVPLGGWWPHVLPSQRVLILTPKGEVPGVIGAAPPHHLSPADREKVMAIKNMVIDIGACSAKEAREMGVELGQAIVPAVTFQEMANPHVISSKAFDDRVGCALMIEVMHRLGKNHPNIVIGAGTAQEEVGIRGAKTAVTLADPDVAIILEGPPADDLPGAADFVQCAMGKGPQIRAYDPTMVTNPRLVELFRDRAAALKLPFQMAVRDSGGTDASVIHVFSRGVPSMVIGVPVRYAHSHLGLMHLQDFENTVSLVVDVIRHLDAKTVQALHG